MTDNTPLKRALDEYIRQDYARLHMPGHKGASISPLGKLMAYDVTEVEGTDSLFEDDGPLKELEEIFTRLYDTKGTVMSAGGSTLCIQKRKAESWQEEISMLRQSMQWHC